MVCLSWGSSVDARQAPKPQAVETLISCEDAIAENVHDASGKAPKDLSGSDFAEVLDRGTYLNACSITAQTGVRICAAVRNGRAIGVTVSLAPTDPEAEACVRERVAALAFPSHPELDIARTTFEAEREEGPKSEGPYVPQFAAQPPAEQPKSGGCACSMPTYAESSATAPALVVAAWLLVAARTRRRRAR